MNENSASKPDGGESGPQPYWNPYVAGLLLGGALLASFLILGAGLGASAVPIRCGAWLENVVAPAHAQESRFFGQKYLAGSAHPLRYYLTFMLVGTFLGGLFSAVLARRVKVSVERGRAFGAWRRVALALAGGVLVGYASALASGCTSGQALTGGALLANGSIVFMLCVFGGGYAAAYFVRRQWHD
ncbi:MAG: YeeE/YedE family protein [Planctomycetes bacterium]|nr:YeeE/YedE family protein [Planctomycetota bacterium]